MTTTPANLTLKQAMSEIVGHQLSSVTFVQDYVQFDFDGSALTAYTLPSVNSGSRFLRWGETGYRDALCEQISHNIQQVEVDEEHVVLLFEGGAAISISLLDEDYTGPEALTFSLDRQQGIWVV